MRHIFQHAKKLGLRASLRITPEIVLRPPLGKVIRRPAAIELLRELAALDVNYRPTYARGQHGFAEIALVPDARVGNAKRKHQKFHQVWDFLRKEGYKPVRVS